MPFAIYDKYESIPEALGRENFRQGKDGKWSAQVTDDHPLVKKRNELLTSNTTLSTDNTSLKEKSIPQGHKIVTTADFTLLELIKQMGLDGEQIKTRLTEYPTLKEKETAQTRESAYDNAGKFLKYDNLEAFKTAMRLSGVEVVWKEETVDNVKVQVPYAGDKKLSDHIQASADLKTMEPFFKTKPAAVIAPRTEAGRGNGPTPSSTGQATGQAAGATPGATPQTPKDNFIFTNPGDVSWD